MGIMRPTGAPSLSTVHYQLFNRSLSTANRSVDAAALSYAMTVHSLVDRQMDMMTAGRLNESEISDISDDLRAYVKWFAEIMEADDNE
ncbi:MAG: hypothetical protein IJR91_07370 [Ruminococcus sp.]|nr:hypothetical protein [Ruminococcus sp.]